MSIAYEMRGGTYPWVSSIELGDNGKLGVRKFSAGVLPPGMR